MVNNFHFLLSHSPSSLLLLLFLCLLLRVCASFAKTPAKPDGQLTSDLFHIRIMTSKPHCVCVHVRAHMSVPTSNPQNNKSKNQNSQSELQRQMTAEQPQCLVQLWPRHRHYFKCLTLLQGSSLLVGVSSARTHAFLYPSSPQRVNLCKVCHVLCVVVLKCRVRFCLLSASF